MSIHPFDFNEKQHASIIVDLLFKTRDRTADVFFVYNGPGADTVRIPAHRNVLATGSKMFNELFFGPGKFSGDIPTRSSTITWQTFEAYISLLYGKNGKFKS